jgi:hypothetical protein
VIDEKFSCTLYDMSMGTTLVFRSIENLMRIKERHIPHLVWHMAILSVCHTACVCVERVYLLQLSRTAVIPNGMSGQQVWTPPSIRRPAANVRANR